MKRGARRRRRAGKAGKTRDNAPCAKWRNAGSTRPEKRGERFSGLESRRSSVPYKRERGAHSPVSGAGRIPGRVRTEATRACAPKGSRSEARRDRGGLHCTAAVQAQRACPRGARARNCISDSAPPDKSIAAERAAARGYAPSALKTSRPRAQSRDAPRTPNCGANTARSAGNSAFHGGNTTPGSQQGVTPAFSLRKRSARSLTKNWAESRSRRGKHSLLLQKRHKTRALHGAAPQRECGTLAPRFSSRAAFADFGSASTGAFSARASLSSPPSVPLTVASAPPPRKLLLLARFARIARL